MKKRKPAPKPAPATGTRGPKGLPTAKLPALPPGTILKGDQIVDRRIMPVPDYDEAMARQIYQNMMDYQRQNIAAQNAANIQNQFQDYARGVGNLMPVQSRPTMGTMQTIAGSQPFLPTIAGPRPVPGQIPQAQNAPASQFGLENMAARLQAINMLPSQNQQQNAPTLMPIQTPQSAAANQALFQAGLGGGIPSPVQQGTAQQQQAMQNYQNFLSQGAANYQAAMQQPLPAAAQPIQPARKNISTAKRTPPIQAF